jgi:hypothetical protein
MNLTIMNDKKLTITEALAEIKTIGKRVETKQSQLESYIVRDSRMRDPMENDGGSVEYIKRERQAINDLQKRVVNLRLAIQQSNMVTRLALNGTDMTVYEWLIWRREVAPHQSNQLSRIWQTLQNARRGAQQRGVNVIAATAAIQSGGNEAQEIIVNVNEQAIAKERENVEAILGELDGRLSLINATTLINI